MEHRHPHEGPARAVLLTGSKRGDRHGIGRRTLTPTPRGAQHRTDGRTLCNYCVPCSNDYRYTKGVVVGEHEKPNDGKPDDKPQPTRDQDGQNPDVQKPGGGKHKKP